MCGIAGFWSPAGLAEGAGDVLRHMTGAIRHRGPDAEGYWCDAQAGAAFGHRRLSIIDLSPEGRQPMHSADGRYVIIYNGEVYNFSDLRAELRSAGVQFRGRSDTEVILAAIQRRGLEASVRGFAGMFAFALFDRANRTLHLVRDRLGEKPLYYGWLGETLLFGSELKALRAHPAWRDRRPGVDRDALTLLLRYGYIPAPFTIYSGIMKVHPGTIISFHAGKVTETTAYWSAAAVVESGLAAPLHEPEDVLVAELDSLLRQSVRREMVSDVPLGALLSGGVDSSLVVALMQAQCGHPVRTFTIGFHEPQYNEAEHARAVARHLGTDHTELYVTPAEALAVVPTLPDLYDEPLGDPSQIPTFLVCELARRHVTVCLSGDGGDELFGGYDRYTHGLRLWRWLGRIPRRVRGGLAHGLLAVAPGTWDALLGGDGAGRSRPSRPRITGDRIHKLAHVLSAETGEAMYRNLLTHWREASVVVRGGTEPRTALTGSGRGLSSGGLLSVMMSLDLVSYLPDDILVKVDRASMGVSLESRAPYLDHQVVEFAWRVPVASKIRRRRGKWLLRRVLDRYVPSHLTDRPKMGFGVPLDLWLRGPLREWAAALLDPSRLRDGGFFDSAAIRQKWDEHQSGARNWQYLLWDVLMFQAWLEAQ